MTGTLLITVCFHDGRYHGAGDWPPSPARLYQALVSAAALPGLNEEKRAALRWLERLDAPVIAAPIARDGQNVNLYVPNNDLDAKGGDIRRIAEIRSATKRIRPRLFNASVPLLYIWRFDADSENQSSCICDIANGLYQLGRGVDMAWATAEIVDEAKVDDQLNDYPGVIYRPSRGRKGLIMDCPEDGSLDSLEARHKENAKRFRRVKLGRSARTEFAQAPKPYFRPVAYNSPITHLLFEIRRTFVSGSPFAPWALPKAATLVQRIRGEVDDTGVPISGAAKKLWDALTARQGEIVRVFIGRNAKEADKKQRIRIIPLPSIGHPHADRGIRRILVEVPPDCPIRYDDIAWAFSGLEIVASEVDHETGEILSSPVELVQASDHSMLSHFGIGEHKASRVWRSVTPLALPVTAARRRIPPERQREEAKGGKERQEEQQRACYEVRQALRHVGIREQVLAISVQREPFEAKGERVERFAAGTRFSKHQLWHVMIEFTSPVSGPLVLGDGRYTGLGVMAAVS
jgi:CRISPR-associated protein Csb2